MRYSDRSISIISYQLYSLCSFVDFTLCWISHICFIYILDTIGQRDESKVSLFWQNYFYHCDKVREERQLEIHEENRFKAHHDDELDAELVGCPPASCTGFYPKTGKLHDHYPDIKLSQHEEDALDKLDSFVCDSDDFVMVEKEDDSNIVE